MSGDCAYECPYKREAHPDVADHEYFAPAVTETDVRALGRSVRAYMAQHEAECDCWGCVYGRTALAAPAATETDPHLGCLFDHAHTAQCYDDVGPTTDTDAAPRSIRRNDDDAERQRVIDELARAYDIVKPEPGMDGPHGGHIGGPSRQKAALAIAGAIEYLAATAVTETDLRAADEACVGDPSHQYHSHDDDGSTDMPTIEEYMALSQAMHDESDLCNANQVVPFDECAVREPDIEDAVRVLVALRREGWRMVRDVNATIPMGLRGATG